MNLDDEWSKLQAAQAQARATTARPVLDPFEAKILTMSLAVLGGTVRSVIEALVPEHGSSMTRKHLETLCLDLLDTLLVARRILEQSDFRARHEKTSGDPGV